MPNDFNSTNPGAEALYTAFFEALTGNCILVKADAPAFTILAATPGYLIISGYTKEALIGKSVFEAFPANPTNPEAGGYRDLLNSFQYVLNHKTADYLPFQRYDMQQPDGSFIEKYWRTSNKPVLAANGSVAYIIHTTEDITSQVIAEKTEAVNRELQFVTDTIPQLAWATEANGYSYFFNRGWLHYTGLSLEEVKGNGWMQSLHPDDLERTQHAWTRAFTDGASYEIDYRLKRYDGEYRWFLTRGTPMKDEKGQILKWYGTTTDIHEQKTSTAALQQSNERFDLMAKATQDAIWDWNLITNEIWWNEGFKELFGYKEEDVESSINSWYSRVHPDDTERVIGGIHEAIDGGGKNWSAEYRFRRKDGSYAIVFDRGYALHDKEGKPWRMLGSMQDITKRKKAEDALRSAHERIIDILESTTDAFYALDANFNFTYVNKRAAQLWGRDAETLIGKHYWTEFPKAVGSLSYHKHYEALKENKHVHFETVSPLLGRWIDTSIYPGKDGALSAFFRDITERKHEEEALELKVKERTKELAKSNEELKRSNQSLEEFAYAASHDLKEPVRKILFFTGHLKNQLAPLLEERHARAFNRIENSTQRMSRLIDDLLMYSYISQQPLKMERVDLNGQVQQVLEDLELIIVEKKAVVEVGELPVVNGYKRQLHQLFQNLISNAIKYSKATLPPRIEINAIVATENEKAYHVITVQDNGIGFEAEYAEQIFQIFTRLHQQNEYSGTGIGLSIVKKVIDNHKGYVKAESIPGVGSTFTVGLPVE